MSRLRVLALATALAVPSTASADVAIKIPRNLLGGRVAPGNPLPPPAPDSPESGVALDPDFTDGVDGIDLLAPNFWALAWPDDAGPVADPGGFVADCDDDADPGSCGLWGNEAAQLVPLDEVIPTIDPGPAPASTKDVAARLSPPIGTWMVDQTPTLRWTPEPGATHYNVQIYLGPRRVASAWTTDTHLTVPPRVLHQGRYYMWAVWPGMGAPKLGEFDEPIGRSVFGVVLRPRIVFTPAPFGVQGQVRPHIPGGILALQPGRGTAADRVPARIRIDGRGRIRLRITPDQAERLGARLISPGAHPPRGILARPAAG